MNLRRISGKGMASVVKAAAWSWREVCTVNESWNKLREREVRRKEDQIFVMLGQRMAINDLVDEQGRKPRLVSLTAPRTHSDQ